jgi:hypothetical protein
MAAPVGFRKPSSSSTESLAPTKRLAAARDEHADTERRIGEVEKARAKAILADADDTARKLDIELENLRRDARIQRDRIQLLEAEAAEKERERKVREKADLIGRIEKKLAARDTAGKELADAIAKADKAFRRLIDIGIEVHAAWNWPASDVPACLLSHGAISAALSHEMYRIGGRPMLGGGQVEAPHAGIHFPGARVPRFELTHMQEKIVPLTAVLQQATAHASNILRGKRSPDIAAPAPVPAMNGDGEPVQRSEAEQRLGALLKQMAALSEDSTREAEYNDVVAALAQVQAEIAAEQQLGARHA